MEVEKKIEELENRLTLLERKEASEKEKRKRKRIIGLILSLLFLLSSLALLYIYAHLFAEILR